MLQKPAPRISLDAASVPVFIEMLAEPYPLEAAYMKSLQAARPTHLEVGVSTSGKIVVQFDHDTDCVTMSPETAKRLAEDVAKACVTPGQTDNPS